MSDLEKIISLSGEAAQQIAADLAKENEPQPDLGPCNRRAYIEQAVPSRDGPAKWIPALIEPTPAQQQRMAAQDQTLDPAQLKPSIFHCKHDAVERFMLEYATLCRDALCGEGSVPLLKVPPIWAYRVVELPEGE